MIAPGVVLAQEGVTMPLTLALTLALTPSPRCVYTHETRLVLLASESSMPVKFVGYQFATSGIIRLPKFELVSQTTGGQRYVPHSPFLLITALFKHGPPRGLIENT